MSGSPFGPGTIILGAAALGLSSLLLVGFLLPTDWSVEASAEYTATPEAVFEYLDSPEGWRAWTAWPDSGLVREGPSRGTGARISWDDRELGTGTFALVDVRPAERVRYRVEVSGGAMLTEGEITLVPEAPLVRVVWREEGDLGRNPLMGFWAIWMERAQVRELDKGLARLGQLLGTPGS